MHRRAKRIHEGKGNDDDKTYAAARHGGPGHRRSNDRSRPAGVAGQAHHHRGELPGGRPDRRHRPLVRPARAAGDRPAGHHRQQARRQRQYRRRPGRPRAGRRLHLPAFGLEHAGAEPRDVQVDGLRPGQGPHHHLGHLVGRAAGRGAQVGAGLQPQGVRRVRQEEQGELRLVGDRLVGARLRPGPEREVRAQDRGRDLQGRGADVAGHGRGLSCRPRWAARRPSTRSW